MHDDSLLRELMCYICYLSPGRGDIRLTAYSILCQLVLSNKTGTQKYEEKLYKVVRVV